MKRTKNGEQPAGCSNSPAGRCFREATVRRLRLMDHFLQQDDWVRGGGGKRGEKYCSPYIHSTQGSVATCGLGCLGWLS